MLKGIDKLNEAIESGETCIKKIVRVKNGFLTNREEFEALKESEIVAGRNPKYSYSDIKFNVLVENEKHGLSTIVEVQFLLKFMLKNKTIGNTLSCLFFFF